MVRNNLVTASTQKTGNFLERTLWGPKAAATKENIPRLDQQRPLQFHMSTVGAMVLANTQDSHNELPECCTCPGQKSHCSATNALWSSRCQLSYYWCLRLHFLKGPDCFFKNSHHPSPQFKIKNNSSTLSRSFYLSLSDRKICFCNMQNIRFYRPLMEYGLADLWYNIDGPWKHYAKWKKLNTNNHILY